VTVGNGAVPDGWEEVKVRKPLDGAGTVLLLYPPLLLGRTGYDVVTPGTTGVLVGTSGVAVTVTVIGSAVTVTVEAGGHWP
jgi:hypothetical protein